MSPEGQPFSETYGTLDLLRALANAWNASPPMQRRGSIAALVLPPSRMERAH